MVDSMCTLSSLEVTRNPFDSNQEERVNCPGFSPSMFRKQETPASQKKSRSFRWSIDQISRLNPADIDEFPCQEYSSTFEREEDEIEAQRAVDEYFSQSSIVPSPWTPNHAAKHVKFSPLPPSTAYIEAISSAESSYSSPSSSSCKVKVDASSQTKLSLPPDFDLQSHIDPTYYNQDGLNGSKDMSMSSLRRKLFSQAGTLNQTEKAQLEPSPNIKSILKSPKTPILITSSPVSEQSTPKHTKHRHSTTSTMSSPNISPIKPVMSVPETPTSVRRPRLSRHSFSPMECSANVLESSGIEVIGDALPDLSPIKGPEETSIGRVQKMDIDNEDNVNNSLDDGGPLEVSSLSVKDDNRDEKGEQEADYDDDNDKGDDGDDDDDDDDEMPPKITMEDLADDLDSTNESNANQSADSPGMEFVELTPRVKSDSEKIERASDDKRKEEKFDHPTSTKKADVKMEDNDSHISDEHSNNTHYRNGYLRSKIDTLNSYHAPSTSSQRSWQMRDYSTTESHKYSHLNELDEDVIMMRAKAALRRANRYSPPIGKRGYSFDPQSLSLSDLSLNAPSAWEPVRMSTPLVPQTSASTDYRNHSNHHSHYGYKSLSSSHRHDFADATYFEESGLGRSGGEMASRRHHYFGRKLSPTMEDITWQRKPHGSAEGKYPFSHPWRKPSSPLYDSGWKFSQTHPMSYVEWKALYWRPPKEPVLWRNNHTHHHTDPYSYEPNFKRVSWPPRPLSSKLTYGSRPLSPPVAFPPAKVPRAVSGGYASKIALPSYQNSSDSGYSDWQRSASRWENTGRSQYSSLGYDFRFY